jgi:beta-N-acetylhexosaminidase
MYARSLLTKDQAQGMIAKAQAQAQIPLFMSIDQEGGGVDRLLNIYGPHPSARTMALSKSTANAQQQGALAGSQMKALGLNLNFAPDVDVQLVAGRDLGSRNFGTDAQTVATYAERRVSDRPAKRGAWWAASSTSLAWGAAADDAHLTLPVISRTRPQIDAVELCPIRTLIATGQVRCIA